VLHTPVAIKNKSTIIVWVLL